MNAPHRFRALLQGALFAASLLACQSLHAQQWGDLTGKFVFDGKAPAPAPLNVTKDPQVCHKHKLVDEALVVDDKGGIANVVVFLRTAKPEVHPNYAKTANDEIVLDNKDCRFEPHVAVLRTSQKLVLKNDDPVGHNTNGTPFNPANPGFNPIVPPGSPVNIANLKTAENVPFPVSCNIHPWMKAYVLLRDDPYAVVSAKDGTFTIKDLPAGKELEFQIWHEAKGNMKAATFKGGTTDAKGRFKMTIKPGANDLGEIKMPK